MSSTPETAEASDADSARLRQRLETQFDEADASTLQDLVARDANVAAAWSETLRTVDKLDAACRADDPAPVATVSPPAPTPVTPAVQPTRSVWRTPSILALVAACIGWLLITLDYRNDLAIPVRYVFRRPGNRRMILPIHNSFRWSMGKPLRYTCG